MVDTYRIKKSEYASNNPDTYIDIELGGINTSATDLSLVGRTREYGEIYNENMLHLLENFASPESDDTLTETIYHAVPSTLTNPIDGQTWFNSSRNISYVYFRGRWYPKSYSGDVASNWGTIAHGALLPLPVGSSGQTFATNECTWIVAPTFVPEEVKALTCSANPTTRQVTMTYTDTADTVVEGEAFYQIVGIKANDYLGDASGFRVEISDYLIRQQVPPLNSFPRTISTTDVVTITTSGQLPATTLRYTWTRVSPSTAEGFPPGYTITPITSGPTSPTATFNIVVSSPGVFVSTQKVVRGATFVCRVDELDAGLVVVGTKLSLPVRVEFYNY